MLFTVTLSQFHECRMRRQTSIQTLVASVMFSKLKVNKVITDIRVYSRAVVISIYCPILALEFLMNKEFMQVNHCSRKF